MLVGKLLRVINTSLSYLKLMRMRTEELNKRIELIEADSRVRGVSREDEVKECIKEVESALRHIDRVMDLIAGKEEGREEERRDLLRAKALVEGRDLSNDIEPVERRIEEIKSRIKEFLKRKILQQFMRG